MDAGRKRHDGILDGTVPRDLPAGTELEVRLGVWPGEIDVFVNNISVGQPATDTDRVGDSVTRNETDSSRSVYGTRVQYLNCSTVKVTGNTDVHVRWIRYFEYGDNYGADTYTVNGTEILRVPSINETPDDKVAFNERGYISFVDVTPEGNIGPDAVHNPEREQCDRQHTPEKVDLLVVNSTKITGATYRVTFAYENPNEHAMVVHPPYEHQRRSLFLSNHDAESERRKGHTFDHSDRSYEHTNRTPPVKLLPGRHTFTVTWTPEHDDARLTWLLDLGSFNETWKNITARTSPATSIGGDGTNQGKRGGSTSRIKRVGPRSEVTVSVDSKMLFEVATRNHSGDHIDTTWYVDGQEQSALGPYHAAFQSQGKDFLRHRFGSTGTHTVRVVVHDENGQELGEKEWTVHVTGGRKNTPPNVEPIAPDGDVTIPEGSTKQVHFRLRASDLDGNLDRAMWWLSQCDRYLGSSSLEGGQDTASITHEASPHGCGLYAWVVDENGEMTRIQDGWMLQRGTTEAGTPTESTTTSTTGPPTTTPSSTTWTSSVTTTTTTQDLPTTETTTEAPTTTTTEEPPDADGDGVIDSKDECPDTQGSEDGGCPDSDGDGVSDTNDGCPESQGSPENDGCPDGDGDGIIDSDDECPDKEGSSESKGCPDSDNDGVIDSNDACADTAGGTEDDGCPDADGDGVVDGDDACPDTAGGAENNGCPDSDGDGVIDSNDGCPETEGSSDDDGCPDSDADGVPDSDDECPETEGSAEDDGCPDSDGDGVTDTNDRCPETSGSSENQGCPDSDGDGVIDSDDDCPDTDGPEDNNGCPEGEETTSSDGDLTTPTLPRTVSIGFGRGSTSRYQMRSQKQLLP